MLADAPGGLELNIGDTDTTGAGTCDVSGDVSVAGAGAGAGVTASGAVVSAVGVAEAPPVVANGANGALSPAAPPTAELEHSSMGSVPL